MSTATPTWTAACWTIAVAVERGVEGGVLPERDGDELDEAVGVGRRRRARAEASASASRSRTSAVASASVVSVTGAAVRALALIRSATSRRTADVGAAGDPPPPADVALDDAAGAPAAPEARPVDAQLARDAPGPRARRPARRARGPGGRRGAPRRRGRPARRRPRRRRGGERRGRRRAVRAEGSASPGAST